MTELSVSLRFVEADTVKKILVAFINVDRITGESLTEAILTWLGLSLSDIRGQCYDGASNMSSLMSGCSSIVKQRAPMATTFTVQLIDWIL